MSVRTLLSGLGATAIIAALSLPLLAQTPPPSPGGRRAGGWEGLMANRLNLTQDQRDQIQKLHEQNRTAWKDQMAKVRDLRHQLNDQLLSDNPDQAQITALTGQIGQIQQQLFAREIQLQQQVIAVFTAEQRQELRQWQQDHPNAGPMGFGRRFRAPRGGGSGGF